MAVKKNKAKLVWIFLKNKILKLFGKKGLDAYELMKDLKVEFKIEDKKTAIYIDNKKIDEKEIHTLKNDMGVSKMAGKVNNEAIYKFARELVDKLHKQSFQTEGFERTINVDVTKCKNAEESTDLVIKKMLEKNYIDSSILKGE